MSTFGIYEKTTCTTEIELLGTWVEFLLKFQLVDMIS